jgi:ATP phosphoribosyltransferase
VVNIVKKYLAKNKVKAKVEFSWGATEAKAGRFVDAIVELTETGSSLRANHLRIVEELVDVLHSVHLQREGLGRSVETGENRKHGDPSSRGFGGGRVGGN